MANEKLAAIQDAAWHKDEFATSDFDIKDKEKKEFSSKEQLEDLYEDKLYKTVTKKKGAKTTSGVEFGDVSEMGDRMDEEAADGEEVVDLSKLSKEQLIEKLMKKAEITSNSHDPVGIFQRLMWLAVMTVKSLIQALPALPPRPAVNSPPRWSF